MEQDLIVSRALVELFSHPEVCRALAFRGGTALHKLHLDSARYSEDIDLVQVHQEPIGQTIDAVRATLSPWLGESVNWEQKHARFTLQYEVESEPTDAPPIRLKVEINTREHFFANEFDRVLFEVDSPWLQEETDLRTYQLEELLGTKLRALYQRDKGRDLFDLWYAWNSLEFSTNEVVDISRTYLERNDNCPSRAEFEINLADKREKTGFRTDVDPLLARDVEWDAEEAFDTILSEFVAQFPGDPWKVSE
ncbi:MAG: nucleotidyl transferase AbiEii/AbiGii toxin family protein [Bradymonadaceae bacterium]